MCPVNYIIITLEQNTRDHLFHPHPSRKLMLYYVISHLCLSHLKEVQHHSLFSSGNLCIVLLHEPLEGVPYHVIWLSLQFKCITSYPVCYEHRELKTFAKAFSYFMIVITFLFKSSLFRLYSPIHFVYPLSFLLCSSGLSSFGPHFSWMQLTAQCKALQMQLCSS